MADPTDSGAWSLKQAAAPGLAVLKSHWPPMLLIHFSALAFVVAYYNVPGLRQATHFAAEAKGAGGPLFTFVVGFVAGSVVPELAKALTGKVRRFDRRWLALMLFSGVVFGLVGLMTDALYWLQALAFGTGRDFGTLVMKTLVDLLLYGTLIAIPFFTVCFDLYGVGFRAREFVRQYGRQWYRRRVTPSLVMAWGYWFPALFCVYALPLDLQFVFAMLLEAAWAILLVLIATRDHAEGPA